MHKNISLYPKIIGIIILGIIIFMAVLLIGLVVSLKIYKDPWYEKILESGYNEKRSLVNRVNFSYMEGPDNGDPLVLLHAQHMDWYSYSRILPALSERFHVFDIDYPGHGTTACPGNYPMTADQIGEDTGAFIRQVIGESVFITGNSSGGLLATWLAANRKESVRAIVLEDPPLFSAEYPRIQHTIAYRSFKTSYNFVNTNQSDFLSYWIKSNSAFFDNNIFEGSASLLAETANLYRFLNPDAPMDIWLIPNDTVRFFIRGLDTYDARFGAAFYDGTWNEGFNHYETLKRISCPVLLLHANYRILDDGTLDGAMSDEDAKRAMSVLSNGTYKKIDATHVVHLDKPDGFIEIIEKFFIDPLPRLVE